MFVDEAKITVRAGDGGSGSSSFHREKFVAAGGPDGGDGGRGGDVIFVASSRLHTLAGFRYQRHFFAKSGENGQSNRRFGKNGEGVRVEVPPGTVVRDAATGKVLLDMREEGVERVLLRGGRGGQGNTHFATATRQAPTFAGQGEKGQELELKLELRSIADVGLVGFPNAGKSTLLSRVSAARPKIDSYPFTTLTPNLGVVDMGGDGFVMADIPGLVEGASQGVGLGVRFLRHVERTRMLVHVVDAAGTEGRDPVEDYEIIMGELAAYSATLAARPMIVAANKQDVTGGDVGFELLEEHLKDKGIAIYPISAVTGEGVRELLRAIQARLAELPPMEPFAEEEVESLFVEETDDIGYTVTREDDGTYVLEGKRVDGLLRTTYFDDEASMNHFQQVLRTSGMLDALRAKGAGEGSSVRMGPITFDFIE